MYYDYVYKKTMLVVFKTKLWHQSLTRKYTELPGLYWYECVDKQKYHNVIEYPMKSKHTSIYIIKWIAYYHIKHFIIASKHSSASGIMITNYESVSKYPWKYSHTLLHASNSRRKRLRKVSSLAFRRRLLKLRKHTTGNRDTLGSRCWWCVGLLDAQNMKRLAS